MRTKVGEEKEGLEAALGRALRSREEDCIRMNGNSMTFYKQVQRS